MKINFELSIFLWLICFGLSFLFQSLGIVNQGTAFILLYCILALIFYLFICVLCLHLFSFGKLLGYLFLVISSILVINIGLVFLFSLGLGKIFNVEITTVFQILTFGMCLQSVTSNSKDK